jgi:hypothetical protein
MNYLEKEARNLMEKGEYNQHVIFSILYRRHPVHYSRIREAIHRAKTA